MKKRYILLALLVVIGLYLHLSYIYIYTKIGTMALISPQTQKTYIINNSINSNLTYIAFGDSLTAGVGASSYEQSYPYQLTQKLSQKNKQSIKLIPLAVPGAKTSDAINLLLDDVVKTKPDIITILFGVNDIHNQMSQNNFYTNYKIILDRLTKETDAQIYIINIPYIGAQKLILPPYSLYFDNRTQEFNKILEQLAKEYQLIYVDLYTQTQEASKQNEYYASDLFHPSDVGYTLWAKIIYDAINK